MTFALSLMFKLTQQALNSHFLENEYFVVKIFLFKKSIPRKGREKL